MSTSHDQQPPHPSPQTHTSPSHTHMEITSSGREYINVSFIDGKIDTSNLPLAPGSGTQYRPEYVNLPLIPSDSGTKTPEPKLGNGTTVPTKTAHRRSATVLEESNAPPPIPNKQMRSDSHAPIPHVAGTGMGLPPRRVMECEQCSDLKQWLSLWQLGVSGLTRQYSQILAQLNHARDAATIIECKMRERWEIGGGAGGCGVGGAKCEEERVGSVRVDSGEVRRTRRKTMLDPIEENSPAHPPRAKTANLADQMYPQTNGDSNEVNEEENPASFPADYLQHFDELSSRLGKAIDLCQQLAVASFKTHTPDVLKKKNLDRKTSQPLSLRSGIANERHTAGSAWRRQVTVDEGAGQTRPKRGVLTRMETEPAIKYSVEREGEMKEKRDTEKKKKGKNSPKNSGKTGLSRSKSRYVPKKDKPPRLSMAGDLFGGGGQQETQLVRSHMMSLIAAGKSREGAGQVGGEGAEPAVIVGSSGSDEGGDLVISHGSTFSDTDVKQVMSKIAMLEDERLKLLETVDTMQSDNQRVRLSLQETVGDLESKDLQLTLAMQDLTLATDEILRVAGLRAQLENMESERQYTLQKLSNLEDESAAVKVSLIQLLQEKSATNKTLALENWRLRQTVKQGDSLSRSNSRSSATHEPTLNYMKEEDLSNYVHKQGFLVKQGRRVKNWKRRLFVLDSTGLSYFKTEQPIQKVRLSDIQKIQVSHNHTILPHMFEVHTPDRVFLLSAPTEDEMQSWIGMLQTLKQYARNPSPPGDKVSTPNGKLMSTDAVLHQVLSQGLVGGKERRSPTLPLTTGLAVRDEVGGVSCDGAEPPGGVRDEGDSRRPCSQAFTMTKELSLDEAIPSTCRPHSMAPTSSLITGVLEWNHGNETILEDTSHEYNRVLSQSHPGTGTQEITAAVIPTVVLET